MIRRPHPSLRRSAGLLALLALLGGCGVERIPQAGAPTPTIVTAAGDIDPPTPAPTLTPTSTPAPTPTPAVLDRAPEPAPEAAVPNVRVSRDQFTAHSETTIAQSTRDPRNLIGASKMFTDNQNYIFRIGTYASFDGGTTWIDNGQLAGLDEYRLTSDPIMVFDSAGTAYIEVLAARDQQRLSALYLYRSTDGGRTWSEPILVAKKPSGFSDKNWLATDTTGGPNDGNLYTTWVHIEDEMYHVLFARSTDGGSTWSEPIELAGERGQTRQAQIVSVGAGGTVYVLWTNLSANRMELVASTDGGKTFSAIRPVVGVQRVDPLNGNLRRGFVMPGFVADPVRPDTLYAAWDDGRLGDADVLFTSSSDGGKTWSPPVIVNGHTRNDQFQPWIAVNTQGELYLQWFDRRDDPRDLLVHTYAARSADGGKTWSEVRVTDVASDPTVGLPMTGDDGFYGDYQALVADADGAYLLWNETRDGSQEVYTARVTDDRWGAAYRPRAAGPIDPNAPPRQEAEDEENE